MNWLVYKAIHILCLIFAVIRIKIFSIVFITTYVYSDIYMTYQRWYVVYFVKLLYTVQHVQ